MSLDRLIEKIEQLNNPTVVGLDPKLESLPPHIKKAAFDKFGENFEGAAEAIFRFNIGIIDALCGIVPAVKPQCAYYELYGWEGMRALKKTIAYAHQKGMFVIADGKRNDIGTTMEAYAAAFLGETKIGGVSSPAFGADALTVNGYLGSDGIRPLLDICEKYDKGVFVLVKTSNPSSGELQDREIDGEPVFMRMGEMAQAWGAGLPNKNGYSAVGAVVGATWPGQLAELRQKLPHTFFLVPGYGAQGGGAKDAANAFDENGSGAIVNSSRAILYAYKNGLGEFKFAQAAREEAERMREDLNAAIAEKNHK